MGISHLFRETARKYQIVLIAPLIEAFRVLSPDYMGNSHSLVSGAKIGVFSFPVDDSLKTKWLRSRKSKTMLKQKE